ncbi:hypothetical protein ABFG93_00145 [Pseudalkalibacillus hwajinpoensis]|uniref:hypothetical protein n=1 Tax=Guptibacillus hwajinpoensis TaxID=208199 RepID=UPI00325C0785
MAALLHERLWIILFVVLFLRWVGAIRYPIYSQLSNDMIPSHVRATTISLLSILDSIFDLLVFTLLIVFAAKGVQSILIGAACIALMGSMLPIKEKGKRGIEGNKAFNH